MRRGVSSSGVLAPALLLMLSSLMFAFAASGATPASETVPEAAGPTITITDPSDGTNLSSSSVEVALAVQNLTLNASAIGKADVPGEGHYQLFLDGNRVAVGASLREDLTRISAGPHLLEAVLANNSGSAIVPRANHSVRFTVAAGSPALVLNSPSEGQVVNSSSPVLLITSANFQLDHASIGKPNQAGRGHLKVYADGLLRRETGMARFPLAGLASGAHSLLVELVENDGTPLSPPVRDLATFTVSADAPLLRLISPADGERIDSTSLRLQLKVDLFPIDIANGSVTAWVDGVRLPAMHDDTTIVSRLGPGRHSVAVALHSRSGIALSPPVEDYAEWIVPDDAPSVRLLSPSPAETVPSSSPFVNVSVGNFPLGAGVGRLLAWLDGHLWANSTTPDFHLLRVPNGDHELIVALSADGITNRTPLVAESVRFTVPSGSPWLSLKSPVATEVTVTSSSLAIDADVRGFKIDGTMVGKSNEPGVGHIVAYVPGMAPQTLRSAKSDIVGLTSGVYRIELQLANNDGSNLTPPAKDVVTVNVPQGAPYLRLTVVVDRHVIVASVEIRDFPLGGAAGKVRYFIDGYLHATTHENSIRIENRTKGEHLVRVELAATDGNPAQPAVVDQLFVLTASDPPKEREDPQLYLAGLGAGAAMLALTIAMAVHGIPIARKSIVRMTEEQERAMTGKRPVRGVR